MKNKLKINLDFVPSTVFFIVGKENYDNFMIKKNIEDELITDAKTITANSENYGHVIAIGIEPKEYCTYQVKGLIVHEIAHAVDFIIDHHGFEGYEFRAYLQQHLYIEIMKFYDRKILGIKP